MSSGKENKPLIGTKQDFFFSLPVEKEIPINIEDSRLVKLSDEFVGFVHKYKLMCVTELSMEIKMKKILVFNVNCSKIL